MKLAALLAIGIAMTGCGRDPRTAAAKANDSAPKTADQYLASISPDTWDRSRQCADQAAKLASEIKADSGPGMIIGWDNHYNPKYRRCFLAMSMWIPKKDRGATGSPYATAYLYDAFDRKTLATLSLPPDEIYCQINDRMSKCEDAQSMIDDRMERDWSNKPPSVSSPPKQ